MIEHRAFLFDTDLFDRECRDLILNSGVKDEPGTVKKFVEDNSKRIKSPYWGDDIDQDWEDEMETKDVQEYADFAMTAYYNPSDDIGLEEQWDIVLEALNRLGFEQAQEAVLGKTVSKDGFTLDPGRCGFGILTAEEVSKIFYKLKELEPKIDKADIEEMDLMLDDMDESDLSEAFQRLLDIYRSAKIENKGLLLTF
ncbi:hypothetical protein [Butyrivibrio sp. NC3005]|uniref:hypothetical protein n=1 Tax=Butyrivibrio sp. NC3005 TaxID=1280685 RepID=UPI00047ABC6E|nr:hypothetical protein [Butyrivibrio sp. NC3005]